jgi:circadian clock protein KaiC
MVKRIKTGIKGFDKLVQGGIPRGYTVLLSGSPGTGKTIFGVEFLKNGAENFNEPGLFITFEETPSNLIMQANQFGIMLKSLKENNKVIIKTLPEQEKLNENILIKTIGDAIKQHKIKRLVIDSLNTYANNIISFEDSEKPISDNLWVKRVVYRLVKKLQKYPQITKILISETEEDKQELSKDGVSEFLCDGVIKIDYTTLGGEYSRQLKVRKMRSTKNIPDVFPLEISSKGIQVHSEKGNE